MAALNGVGTHTQSNEQEILYSTPTFCSRVTVIVLSCLCSCENPGRISDAEIYASSPMKEPFLPATSEDTAPS